MYSEKPIESQELLHSYRSLFLYVMPYPRPYKSWFRITLLLIFYLCFRNLKNFYKLELFIRLKSRLREGIPVVSFELYRSRYRCLGFDENELLGRRPYLGSLCLLEYLCYFNYSLFKLYWYNNYLVLYLDHEP